LRYTASLWSLADIFNRSLEYSLVFYLSFTAHAPSFPLSSGS
jgi:hypothetical protein